MDALIFQSIQKIAGLSPVIDGIGVFFASELLFVMVLGIAVFWFASREHRIVAASAAYASAFFAWLINQEIGALFFRPRPFASLDNVRLLIEKSALEKSFPSDHAAIAFAMAMAVFLVDRRLGRLFFFLAALVSFGRVFVGVHYPTDVVAGASIGIFIAYTVHRLIHHYLHTKHHSA